VLGLTVLGLFAVLAGLALAPDAVPPSERPQRWLERVLALLSIGFVGLHALHVWPDPGPHSSAGTVYDALTSSLGRPIWLFAYVVGITAIAGHLGLTLLSWQELLGRERARLVRAASFVIAAGLWLAALSVLSWFAIGAGLF
jgi:hypothetical protein